MFASLRFLRRRPFVVGLAALAVAGALSLALGAASLPLSGVLREMVGWLPGGGFGHSLDVTDRNVLWQFRAPRTVLAGLVGAALSLCGAGYQGAFRNPLVDPYLLGSAAGAGFGATLVIGYFPSLRQWPVDPLPIAAFIGALLAVGLSYGVSRAAARPESSDSASGTATLVLAGVSVASLLTALQTFAQQQNQESLRSVYAWILGGLTTSGWSSVFLILPYLVLALGLLLWMARSLDVLGVGDVEATSLGVSPQRVRTVVVLAASLGTAAAVAVSGLIGFVGLVVPHAVRLVFGGRHRQLLPASALFGAAFLMIADVLARTVIAPAELSIGVVTAFVGAPFFAYLLIRRSAA